MRSVAIVLLTLCCASGTLFGQIGNVFVSPSGDDQNAGTSYAQPFKTMSRAISTASAGDTIFVLAGLYHEVIIFPGKNGNPDNPICIVGYPQTAGQKPVIDGGALTPSISGRYFWMNIVNSSWIEVRGLAFQNGWTDPIQLTNSSYITFAQCSFSGGRRVIAATGSNTHHLLVENCTWDQGGNYLWTLVTDAGGNDAWTSMHEGAMAYYNGSLVNFSGTGGSVVIRHNTITNAFNGIRWTAQKGYDSNVEIYDNTVTNIRDNDFEPEYYTYNLLIHHNQSHNIHKTMSVDNVAGGYIYYFGNQITSDGDAWSDQICTAFWKVYGEGTYLTYPMYAFNNSFCGVGKAFGSMAGRAVQLKHFNNAYYFTGSRGWNLDYWDSTNVFDYDVSNKSWPPNLQNNNQELNGKVVDVKYVSAKNFDLRLLSGSPAIDAGKVAAFSELGWVQTFQGSAPDVGAFEGSDPVEGPAFRFRTAPELNIQYKEKPRIVRSNVRGRYFDLYFSSPIDPSTFSASTFSLRRGQNPVRVLSAVISNDDYRITIEGEIDLAGGDVTLGFDSPPAGMNGEHATMWAANLAPYKSAIPTGISEPWQTTAPGPRPALSIYPNPLNGQAVLSVDIPASTNTNGKFSLRIVDVVGRKVKEMTMPALRGRSTTMLDCASLASGVYYAVLTLDRQVISQKFVVLK